MNPITEILPGVYVVDIPKTAWNFSMKRNVLEFSIGNDWSYVSLPPGDYTFLFTTHSMTEEQAGSLVKKHPIFKGWWDYESNDERYVQDTRIESFHSALTAKNLDTNKHYAVLQKNK